MIGPALSTIPIPVGGRKLAVSVNWPGGRCQLQLDADVFKGDLQRTKTAVAGNTRIQQEADALNW